MKGIVCTDGIVWGIKKKGQGGGARTNETTPCEDLRAIEELEKQKKNPPNYIAVGRNCRAFARVFAALGREGFKDKKFGKCCNPDGTPWVRK